MSFQKIDNKLTVDQLIYYLLKQSLKTSTLNDNTIDSESSISSLSDVSDKLFIQSIEPDVKLYKINSKIMYNYNTLIFSFCHSFFPDFRHLKSDDQISYMRNIIYKMLKEYTESNNHEYKTILKMDNIIDKHFDKNTELINILCHYFHCNIIVTTENTITGMNKTFNKNQNIIILYENLKKFSPVHLKNIFMFENNHKFYQEILQLDSIKNNINSTQEKQSYTLPISVSNKLKVDDLRDIAKQINVSIYIDDNSKKGKLKTKLKEQLINDINIKLQEIHNIH